MTASFDEISQEWPILISPLLANIYLHYALDLRAVRWRRREPTGDMIIVRYADVSSLGSSTGARPGAS